MSKIGFTDENATIEFANYMTYRIQLSMYKTIDDDPNDPISWDDFGYTIREEADFRYALKKVLYNVLKQCSISSFEFDHGEEKISFFDDPDKTYTFFAILDENESRSIISKLLLKAQISYYFYLFKQLTWKGKLFFTWQEFCCDVLNDKKKLTTLLNAFKYRIISFDYDFITNYYC